LGTALPAELAAILFAPMTADDEALDETRMTLGQHLEELRSRLIRATLALVVVFGLAWAFRVPLYDVAFGPYGRASAWLDEAKVEYYDEQLETQPELDWSEYFTSPDEATRELLPELLTHKQLRADAASAGFFMYMRVCFFFALFVAGPFVLWQIWQFVAAGLYKREKSVAFRYFPFSVLLFVGGAVFGYFMMVPYAIFFLAKMTIGSRIEYWETIDNYWTFLTSLTLALGAVFQLPVIMLALGRLGLVEPKVFAKYRGHCIVGALVLAAVITPPDPFTQMLMAIPIVALYELGIWITRFAIKRAGEPSAPTNVD
jgi:sec-independent protein translocase protein TatC